MKSLLIILLLLLANLSFAQENTDPFEAVNRSVYKFNDVLDKNLLKPTTKAYQEHVPMPAQKGLSNFFGNLGNVITLSNQILQFKPADASTTFGRILVNSTFGMLGLFDVADEINLTTRHEDFGQTLAVWGVPQGPYMVLPLLGPSSLRDGAGTAADFNSPANVVNKLDGLGTAGVGAISIIDKRSKLTSVIDFVNQSDDPYITSRSSYLQKRKFNIYDGDLPDEEEEF